MVNQVYKSISNSESQSTDFPAVSTIEFKGDGTVLLKVDWDISGSIDPIENEVGTYRIENSNLMMNFSVSETFSIKTLTTTACSISQVSGDTETTINLKR